jgi:hypothetical protein
MTLYVDGKKVGEGSATIEVKAGKHLVKGRNKSLGITKSKRIRVTSGKTASVSLTAHKGGLIIDAPPGSVVYVDGKKRGKAPMGVIELYSGKHKVLVRQGAAQYRQSVPIRAGLDTTLTVNFYER